MIDDWFYGRAVCMACGYRWVCVFPDGTDLSTLECAHCRAQQSKVTKVDRPDA